MVNSVFTFLPNCRFLIKYTMWCSYLISFFLCTSNVIYIFFVNFLGLFANVILNCLNLIFPWRTCTISGNVFGVINCSLSHNFLTHERGFYLCFVFTGENGKGKLFDFCRSFFSFYSVFCPITT